MNDAGIALLEKWEKESLVVFDDGFGNHTVGCGHRTTLPIGATISESERDALFRDDLFAAEFIVESYVKVPLTDNQRAALECFVFNVGPGTPGIKDGFVWLKSGNRSTMLKLLNAGDYEGACEEFQKWDHIGGKEILGLTRRRADEAALFATPDG